MLHYMRDGEMICTTYVIHKQEQHFFSFVLDSFRGSTKIKPPRFRQGSSLPLVLRKTYLFERNLSKAFSTAATVC